MTHRNTLPHALALCLLLPACRAENIKPVDRRPLAELAEAIKGKGYKRLAQGSQEVWTIDPASDDPVMTGLATVFVTVNEGTGEWTLSVFHDETVGSTLLIGKNLVSLASGTADPLPAFDRKAAEETVEKLKACDAEFYPDAVQRLMEKFNCRRAFRGEVTFMLPSVLEAAHAAHRSDIDSRVLDITLDGKKIQITQGNLRKAMVERVNELKERRAQLLKEGASPEERAQTEALAKRYGLGDETQEEPDEPDFRGALEPAFAEVLVTPDGRFVVLAVDRRGACVRIAVGEDFSVNP